MILIAQSLQVSFVSDQRTSPVAGRYPRTVPVSLQLWPGTTDSGLQTGVQVSAYEQINELPEIKENFPEYKEIHSQVLQDVLRRLDKAFQSFLRRAKEGKEKPGFPRYKGQGRYDSFTYPQPREKNLPDGGRVHLPKIGVVKIKYHRALTGKAKTITAPAYTSQACSNCGEMVKKSLSVRVHRCPACGLILDRDVNAARNILALTG